MIKIVGLLVIMIIVTACCDAGEKESIDKNENHSSQDRDTLIYFRTRIDDAANPLGEGYLHNDSIIVAWEFVDRHVFVILKKDNGLRDTVVINEVNYLIKFEKQNHSYFGIEVGLRCGSDCSSHEYYLFKVQNGELLTVLAFKSYFGHSLDQTFDRKTDSLYDVHERSEYVAAMLNLITMDGNRLRFYETQSEEYHYYEQPPYNFSKEHILEYDSLNNVYCNAYIDLSGNYTLISDEESVETKKNVEQNSIPAFAGLKYTYIFFEKKWAILSLEKEIRFLQ